MSTEAKRREVLQLLKDYRSWHSAFGGALPLDETHVVDAAYGPAGYIEPGAQFEERDRKPLKKSYEKLGHALTMLKQENFRAWMALVTPYLGDPADPSVVAEHRRKAEGALLRPALRGPPRPGAPAFGDVPGEGAAAPRLPEADE